MLFERSPQSQIIPPSLKETSILGHFAGYFGRKSTLLAGLASISIHGLALILLSYISDFETTPSLELPSPIQVVALTPTEQSRIPTLVVPRTSIDTLPAIFYQPVFPIPPKRTQSDSLNLSVSLHPSPSPSPKLATPQPSPAKISDYSLYRKPIFLGKFPVTLSPTSSPPPTSEVETNPEPATTASPMSETPNNTHNWLENPLPQATPLIENDSTQLAFNSSNTSDEAGNTNYQNWATRLEISSTKFQKVFVKGTYPEIACPKKLNGEVGVAVLIDPDKQPNYLEVIKSSGYKVFDEEAITDAMAANFEQSVIGEPYIVIVKYEQDSGNCDVDDTN
ncbi:energy transducer TonB [Merismopedia glauca]|uniref:TonB C-terminal domain-containing protein n=1 Tax=Merismopedia glauca CCAP 1448/3 TaxID=1296344 RepID=A0A2T1C4B0_9CYAN|nr:energy transducer TonB [Merismopedia glauca]PSB03089.1 hypothetical protein C7B64_10150 [Merismopedia glauca CCAP 1448/3]